MHPVLRQLLERGPVLTDGAWGTELQARGLSLGEFPDSWNFLHPERVAAVAGAYVHAGSRIILTNTFGANRIRLLDQGLAQKSTEINTAGVKISLQAAAGRSKVFASMGPSGRLLLNGAITREALQDAFTEQAQTLAAAGADGLVVETMSDLEEAQEAVIAARKTDLPIVACMVFDSGKAKDRTMMGQTPEQAAQVLSDAGADVIGANCGQGVAGFIPICKRLRAATNRPIWIKANAGLPTVLNGKATYRMSPDEFAAFLPELLAAGAMFVGGCCGTGPAFIQALSTRLYASEEKPRQADPAVLNEKQAGRNR